VVVVVVVVVVLLQILYSAIQISCYILTLAVIDFMLQDTSTKALMFDTITSLSTMSHIETSLLHLAFS